MRTSLLAFALAGFLVPLACGGAVAPGDGKPVPSSSSTATGGATGTPAGTPTGSSTGPESRARGVQPGRQPVADQLRLAERAGRPPREGLARVSRRLARAGRPGRHGGLRGRGGRPLLRARPRRVRGPVPDDRVPERGAARGRPEPDPARVRRRRVPPVRDVPLERRPDAEDVRRGRRVGPVRGDGRAGRHRADRARGRARGRRGVRRDGDGHPAPADVDRLGRVDARRQVDGVPRHRCGGRGVRCPVRGPAVQRGRDVGVPRPGRRGRGNALHRSPGPAARTST